MLVAHFDKILKNGLCYDGLGNSPVTCDIGITGDRISQMGDLSQSTADEIVDVSGLCVAPGFINMLSWAVSSLIHDGRSLSDIKQGVTLEIFGEGWSWGPVNDYIKAEMKSTMYKGLEYDIVWDTLGEYLQYLENKGISCNVASFVGATTVRMYVLQEDNRAPTHQELLQMKALVRIAMEEGALGVGSSLIYPPAFFATTEELIELCKVASLYGGMYISHMRSEGVKLIEGIEELIRISEEADIRSEIYHLKAAGKNNWSKLEAAIAIIEEARSRGLHITTDMYTYPAAATGLDSCLPPEVQDGGRHAFVDRLKDPKIRAEMKEVMGKVSEDWENLYVEAGPDNILLSGFMKAELEKYMGMRVSEIAKQLGKDPRDTIIDLLIEDESRIDATYFIMNEENVKRKVGLPFMSFGSDAGSIAPDGNESKYPVHPRTYGTFARVLGKYVRDEKVISLEEAIRKLTSFPAENLGIKDRGTLKEGFYADIVIFDPENVRDIATYEQPHQLAEGMIHVFVNGEQVLKNGEHTGKMPGRAVWGPGKTES